MNTPDLPLPEYWFYRVSSELTIALLHQVNNELTGVIFTAEDIEQEISEGLQPKEKFFVLHESVQKVINLIQETVNANAAQQEMLPNPQPLGALIKAEIPILRLLIPKSVGISFFEKEGEKSPSVIVPAGELRILLAAIGLLLRPAPSRFRGCEFSLKIEIDAAGRSEGMVAIRFTPDYQRPAEEGETTAEALLQHPDYHALDYRLRRLGGKLDLPRSKGSDGPFALRVFLPEADS